MNGREFATSSRTMAEADKHLEHFLRAKVAGETWVRDAERRVAEAESAYAKRLWLIYCRTRTREDRARWLEAAKRQIESAARR